MKIALAQINTTVGDCEGNFIRVQENILRAQSQDVDLILFPELTLTGYPPRDLVYSSDFIETNLKALDRVAQLSKNIAIIVGYIDRNLKLPGRSFFNAAALCVNGQIQARYYKSLIPHYDIFDEGHYFEPGHTSGLWSIPHLHLPPFGISICEDAWSAPDLFEKNLYLHHPIKKQVEEGAKFLINLSASPFSIDKPNLRKTLFSHLAAQHQVPVLYVNMVGGNDEIIFDGRSFVMGAHGEIVMEAKAYEEDLKVVDLDVGEDLNVTPRRCEVVSGREDLAPTKVGKLRPYTDLDSLFEALVLGVRDYTRKCGFEKVLLGLSGGIDSSLVAAIAAEALGSKNVTGIAMPSPYSSPGSVTDAQALAQKLGISFETYEIHPLLKDYRLLLPRQSLGETDLAEENLQARIRGNILMALSNRHGGLVLTTGNKSEIAMGYSTLYGDMCGGLAVIADLYKTQVYDLCFYLQKLKNIFPADVLSKSPSAELRPHQKDEDSLPPYSLLDSMLKAFIEENKSVEEVIALGFPAEIVQDVFQRLHKNEYKRQQAAPGLRVSSRAFGMGWRYPIAKRVSRGSRL